MCAASGISGEREDKNEKEDVKILFQTNHKISRNRDVFKSFDLSAYILLDT